MKHTANRQRNNPRRQEPAGVLFLRGTVRHERLHQGPPELPEANTAEEKKAKKDKATALQERIKNIAYIPANARELTDAVKNSLADYLEEKTPETPEPSISQKDLFALQESVESFTVYDDNHQTLSTLELTIGGRPFYPEEYPIANIVPRYRKSFSETMYRTAMPVHEADIFIRFVHISMQTAAMRTMTRRLP